VETLSREILQTEPGRVVLYNCSNYFLLARALEKLTSQPLDELIARYLLRPLRLENTTFSPCDLSFVAPTETKRVEKGFWHGVPHDEAARAWQQQTGTCAGNAGLFATAADVARFASIWLLDGHNSPLPSVWRARAMMHLLPEGNATRGWGWQRDAAYYMGTLPVHESGRRSFLIGHLGFTGTSLVLNPRAGEVAVVLSNRVHPTRLGPDRLPFVRALHDEFWRSSP
jgi:CubicO group peptidase (beta-lactamase class C family)